MEEIVHQSDRWRDDLWERGKSVFVPFAWNIHISTSVIGGRSRIVPFFSPPPPSLRSRCPLAFTRVIATRRSYNSDETTVARFRVNNMNNYSNFSRYLSWKYRDYSREIYPRMCRRRSLAEMIVRRQTFAIRPSPPPPRGVSPLA